MVVARDGLRGQFDEVGGFWVPDFGDQLGCVVREGLAVDLTAGDEDFAVGEDDGVGEDALVPHWVYFLGGDGGE